MSIFHVICNMTISQCGPVVGYELVHLRQGDMDGACGPYSLMMCLILQGVVRREDVVALNNLDGRTALGKLWNKFQDFHALFRQGTTLQDIGSLLATFGRIEDAEEELQLAVFHGYDNAAPILDVLERLKEIREQMRIKPQAESKSP